MVTPGTTVGYWNARYTPSRARSSGSRASRSWSLKRTDPPVTSYPGWPIRVLESVLLPEPLGPMTACTSPRLSPSETPRRISRPSTETCRSWISKSANFLPLSVGVDVVGAARVAGAQPRRAGDRGAQQPPVHVQLVPAGVAAARGDVLDGTVAVPELELAVRALDQLGHVALLPGQPDQLANAVGEVQPRQPGAVLRLQPARPRGEEALQLVLVEELHQLPGQLAVAARELVGRGVGQPVDVPRPARPGVVAGRDLDQAPPEQRIQVPEGALLAHAQLRGDLGQAHRAPGLQQREDVLLAVHDWGRLYRFVNANVDKSGWVPQARAQRIRFRSVAR